VYGPHVGIAGYCHLAAFGVLIPLLAVKTSRKLLATAYQPRQKQFIAIILQLLFFAVFSIWVALTEYIRAQFPDDLLSDRLALSGNGCAFSI